MFTNDLDFKKDLIDHKIFSSWQFIQYTQKNIEVVQYCADIIKRIIEKMEIKTTRWQQDLFSSFIEETTDDGKKIRKVAVTTENMPSYELHVAGEKVDPWFLFDKLVRDFYQYAMNSFDSMGQVANAGLLANKGKKVDSVDFQKMTSCFMQQTYRTSFPKMSAWFENVSNTAEFQYIEAINNRTKHTADIKNKLSMGILGSSSNAKIGPFFRKDVQHDKRELSDQMQAALDFLDQSWGDFLNIFCEEYILDQYTANRRHKIDGVFQQKLKGAPEQDLSYAYINLETDFSTMPDELYILFICDDEEIMVHDCPFEQILVRDNDEKTIHGRYIADNAIGDDCLLHYRKYVKDSSVVGQACLFYEHQTKTVFYHNNPYFSITTVSDDDEFLGRVTLPF